MLFAANNSSLFSFDCISKLPQILQQRSNIRTHQHNNNKWKPEPEADSDSDSDPEHLKGNSYP